MRFFVAAVSVIASVVVTTSDAFSMPTTTRATSHRRVTGSLSPMYAMMSEDDNKNDLLMNSPTQIGIENDDQANNLVSSSSTTTISASSSPLDANVVSAVSIALWTLTASSANAAGPDWGIFEGRTGSLLHPVMMFGMFALSVSTALLGFDWRRQRTIGDEISSLKKTLPDLGGASTVADALAAAKGAETPDTALVSKLQAAIPIESEIKELQSERKQLAEKGPRDKHYGQGAWLALIGTWFAIEGPLNTYARAGKLFPGPHLYAGAGLVCLWALAVATIPQMQKGSDVARYVHIGANLSGIAMFAWQIQSGIPILLKVIELTKWP